MKNTNSAWRLKLTIYNEDTMCCPEVTETFYRNKHAAYKTACYLLHLKLENDIDENRLTRITALSIINFIKEKQFETAVTWYNANMYECRTLKVEYDVREIPLLDSPRFSVDGVFERITI